MHDDNTQPRPLQHMYPSVFSSFLISRSCKQQVRVPVVLACRTRVVVVLVERSHRTALQADARRRRVEAIL
jgi:hypothetical protein